MPLFYRAVESYLFVLLLSFKLCIVYHGQQQFNHIVLAVVFRGLLGVQSGQIQQLPNQVVQSLCLGFNAAQACVQLCRVLPGQAYGQVQACQWRA